MADNIGKAGEALEKALDKSQEGGFSKSDQPEEGDAGRFAELLSSAPSKEVGQTGQQPQTSVQDTQIPALTLGDKVLQGMQGLKDHVEQKADLVKLHMAPGDAMGMKDMFQTQMAMTNLMITEDYIGKIVSKSTQTFDTLLRNQ